MRIEYYKGHEILIDSPMGGPVYFVHEGKASTFVCITEETAKNRIDYLFPKEHPWLGNLRALVQLIQGKRKVPHKEHCDECSRALQMQAATKRLMA